MKHTKQRQVILDELRKVKTHPTAEELYEKVKKKLPDIGVCTVYRNLEQFSNQGIVEKIVGKKQRFDGNTTPHNHIKCHVCGKVEDIYFEVPVDVDEIKSMGYEPCSYFVEINGICKNCNKKGELNAKH